MQLENLFTPDKIRTFSGIYIDPLNPKPEDICIEDIAHALSNQCRFGGHLPEFYTVAQHSCHVAEMCEDPLAGLLHDASEAYLLDIPSPIKQRIPEYKAWENNLMEVIAMKFGFTYPFHESVKAADKLMLQREWDHIFINQDGGIHTWDRKSANTLFLRAFRKYSN